MNEVALVDRMEPAAQMNEVASVDRMEPAAQTMHLSDRASDGVSSAINDESLKATTNAERTSLWHSANTKRYIATGIGIAGLASAAAALYLYRRGGPEPEAASISVHARLLLQPIFSSDQAGLVLQGGF